MKKIELIWVGMPVWTRVCLMLFITFLIAKAIRKIFDTFGKNDTIHIRFLENISSAVAYIIGIVGAIKQIPGVESYLTAILAGSGVVAIVIGLAAQDSLGNLFSGMFIALNKPFDVGDRIKLITENISGTVEDITLRHTVIKTFVNSRVIVPNSVINKAIFENYNIVDEKSSSFLDIAIMDETKLDRAMEIMQRIISKHPKVIDVRTEEEMEKPKVEVTIRSIDEKGIGLRACVWTNTVSENFAACSDIRYELIKEFSQEKIEIPFNRLVVNTKYDKR